MQIIECVYLELYSINFGSAKLKINYVRFEVFTAVTMKNGVF
jgi:hypothetical protein